MIIRIAYLLIFTSLLFLTSQESQDITQLAKDVASMEGQVLAEEAKQKEDINSKLKPFIIEELKEYYKEKDFFKDQESFVLKLSSDESFKFRYKIQSNPNPSVAITIYTQQTQDDLAPIKDHDQERYLEVSSSAYLQRGFQVNGKVYMRKIVLLGSHSGSELFVFLKNKFDRNLIIEISLSGAPTHIDRYDIVKNSHFSSPANKLIAISDEMREVETENRKIYKFQWGFLERQEHHDAKMLGLTGFEAVIIIATTIVQTFCVRSLVDSNRII